MRCITVYHHIMKYLDLSLSYYGALYLPVKYPGYMWCWLGMCFIYSIFYLAWRLQLAIADNASLEIINTFFTHTSVLFKATFKAYSNRALACLS